MRWETGGAPLVESILARGSVLEVVARVGSVSLVTGSVSEVVMTVSRVGLVSMVMGSVSEVVTAEVARVGLVPMVAPQLDGFSALLSRRLSSRVTSLSEKDANVLHC